MSEQRTYLDYNATAPLHPRAAEAFCGALQWCGNPSSVHAEGRRARAGIEGAREHVAALVNAPATGIVFTSSGTEANNLAFNGAVGNERIGRLLVASIEHPSVLEAARARCLPAREIAVTPHGVVDLEDLHAALRESDERAMISVMLANNETGVLQPLGTIVKMAHEYDALVHTDAVQCAGKTTVDFAKLGVDLMSLSSHKMGGPLGVGVLAVRDGIELGSQIRGGGQEAGRRAGTENVPAIVGLGAVAQLARDMPDQNARTIGLRDLMERSICESLATATILGAGTERLPNTTCLAVPGVRSEYLLIALDLEGFAISSGSACSSGKVARSHVLAAMGVAQDLMDCAIRVSIGWQTREHDLERFVAALTACCERKEYAATEAAA